MVESSQHFNVDFTCASFWARAMSTTVLSSRFAFNMARRAVVKWPLVSLLITSSRLFLYSDGENKSSRRADVREVWGNHDWVGTVVTLLHSRHRVRFYVKHESISGTQISAWTTTKKQINGTKSGRTFLENPLDLLNLFIWSGCQNLHKDILMRPETLDEVIKYKTMCKSVKQM